MTENEGQAAAQEVWTPKNSNGDAADSVRLVWDMIAVFRYDDHIKTQ